MAKGGPTLLLDIDSSSVGACIFENDAKPILKSVKRLPIGTGETRETAALIPLLKEALTGLLSGYAKGNPKLTSVSVVVASPWFASTLRTLSSKSDKPVKVSAASIKRIVAEHRKTEHEAAGKHTLEALPVTVLVNGYRSQVNQTVHGKTLAVTLYESIADQSFVQTVDDAVRALFPRSKISWHTTPLAYAETLLRVSDEDHATVIDVGGEVTDVMVLSHQSIAYVGSVPIGARTIQRTLSTSKDGSLADSASRLTMFARGELAQKEMESTAAALTKAAEPWRTGFLDVLAEAGNTVPVPHRVFVVGERDELPWFAQLVSGAESRGQRPQPTVVTADFFGTALSYGDNGFFDASLALDALFFHMRSSDNSTPDGVGPVLYSVQ